MLQDDEDAKFEGWDTRYSVNIELVLIFDLKQYSLMVYTK